MNNDGRRGRLVHLLHGEKLTLPFVDSIMIEQHHRGTYSAMRTTIKKLWYEQYGYTKESYADIEWYFSNAKQPMSGRNRIPRYITTEQLCQLIAGANSDRQKAFIGFLSLTGLRISEMLELKLSDITYEINYCHIKYIAGKTKMACYRQVALEYLIWVKSVFEGTTYLFETQNGIPPTRSYVSGQISEVSKRVLGFSIRTHALRHYWTTNQFEIGTDPFIISEMLGHRNTGSQFKYYIHKTLKEAHYQMV